MHIISFDIGGTRIKHGLLDEAGTIASKGFYPTPRDKQGFLEQIAQTVENYEKEAVIEAVTLSFPGYINPNTGYAETSGAILFFYNQNIAEQISEKIEGRYPVYLENDANCVALAEKASGNAQDDRNFFVMTVGTGIGGALFLNGELYRGFQYKAGEYGRMRINHTLAPDKTMHDFSSIRILINQYKELKGLGSDEAVSGEEILEQMEDDSEVKGVVENWIDTLCIGLFNVTTVINPEKILIGGGISSHPLFLEMVRDRMYRIWDWPEFKVPIVECKYFNDAGLIGAHYHALQKLGKLN